MQLRPVTTHELSAAAIQRDYLKEQLLVQFPGLSEDDHALADTLDGISDLDQMIVAVMRTADDDAMLVAGIEARMTELKERHARLEMRIATKRDIVGRVMERADIRKIEAPDFTLSLRNGAPKVTIIDEGLIPPSYWREKITKSIDRAALSDALKANIAVPGAALSNGGVSLSVRKK